MAEPAVDLAAELSQVADCWAPRVVARINDYEVKVVRLKGSFLWHRHRDTDELFLVTRGMVVIQLREGQVKLRSGQLFVVPRGVEHRPMSSRGAEAILLEPGGVVSTGDPAQPPAADGPG